MEQIYTVADLLCKVSFWDGWFYCQLTDEEREKSYITSLIVLDTETSDSDIVMFFDPDQFAIELEEKLEHCIPIAVQISEDDEEASYPNAYLVYLSDEPSIEEKAIVDATFALDEKLLTA
jgi:hypothetical protein